MSKKFYFTAVIRTLEGNIETHTGYIEFFEAHTLDWASRMILRFEVPDHLETLKFKVKVI